MGHHTFLSVFNKYFQIKYQRLSQTSIKRYLLLIKKVSELYDKDIASISRQEILQIYTKMNSYTNTKKLHYLLRETFDYALLWGFVEHNPIKDINLSLLLHKPRTKHRAYTTSSDTIKQLIKLTNSFNPKMKTYFILLFHTLLRVSTLSQLRVSHFDFKNNLLIIPAEIMKTNTEHILPLDEKLMKYLLEYFWKEGIDDYLFPSKQGHINPEYPRILLAKYISNKVITPHGFRAMFSTICNDNEQDRLGIELVLSHYNSS